MMFTSTQPNSPEIIFLVHQTFMSMCVNKCKISFMQPLKLQKMKRKKKPTMNDCLCNREVLNGDNNERADRVKAKLLPSGLVPACNFFEKSMSLSFSFCITCCSFSNIPVLHNFVRQSRTEFRINLNSSVQ
jgi:hypothetical protein